MALLLAQAKKGVYPHTPELALDVLAVVVREQLSVIAEEHKGGRLDARLEVGLGGEHAVRQPR